jgi:hypothetical protein
VTCIPAVIAVAAALATLDTATLKIHQSDPKIKIYERLNYFLTESNSCGICNTKYQLADVNFSVLHSEIIKGPKK